MKYGKLLGRGIVIYAVLALATEGLTLYGLHTMLTGQITQLLVLVLVATIAGRSLRFHSWKDILPYSFSWAVLAALLNAVYNVPLEGWGIYTDWSLWLGYGLIVAVPLFAPMTRPLPEMPQD